MDFTESVMTPNKAGLIARGIACRLAMMRPDCMKDWSFFDLLKLFNKITIEQCVKLFGLRHAIFAHRLIYRCNDLTPDTRWMGKGIKRAKNTFIVNGWSEEECAEAVAKIFAFGRGNW